MRVLAACSLGGRGHLDPLLPLVTAARRAGADVAIVAPPSMQEMVEGSGHRFLPGAEPPEASVAPIRERLPVAAPEEASVLGNRELFARLACAAMLPPMTEHCARFAPDLVLRDPCEYASAVVAARDKIPAAQVAISLAEVEWGSLAVAAPALDGHRPGLTERLRSQPYLTRFPAGLDPSPFPTTRRFREPAARPPTSLPDWWAGSRAPLISLSFGTVLGHMTAALEVYRAAIRAVAPLDARVLLTVGRTVDPAALGPVPPHVHVEQWVDQADVLARADLVVCHGGSGTVFGALGAGVPVVVVPIFADQFENGRRVAASGAGLVVDVARAGADGSRRLVEGDDAPVIAATISRALATPGLRDHAGRIASEMAAAPDVDRLLAELLDP